jgi:hypothetical protein
LAVEPIALGEHHRTPLSHRLVTLALEDVESLGGGRVTV